MLKSLAIYTTKPVTTGARVQELASTAGWSLRYMGLGGTIPNSLIENDRYAGQLVDGILIVGADSSQAALLAEFDSLYEKHDSRQISRMLNQEQLRWVELYAGYFHYEEFIAQFPKSRADLESAVPADQMDRIVAAKTRYIVHNFSGSKDNGVLMRAIASLLTEDSIGLQITHKKPKR